MTRHDANRTRSSLYLSLLSVAKLSWVKHNKINTGKRMYTVGHQRVLLFTT